MTPKDQAPSTAEVIEKTQDPEQILVPLHAEEISVGKRRVVTGRVKVATVTRQHEQLVDELLASEHVEIERTAIGKQVDTPPVVREDGDTLVIPIIEEVVVVERRLLLKEEVRIRRVRETQRHQERVILRKQEAVITRLPADTNQVAAAAATKADQ